MRYDLQFLETIDTDTNNVSPRVGFAVVAVRVAPARSSAAAPASSTTACRSRALANALLSAGNTTDLSQPAPDQRQPVADADGAPVFPNILAGVGAVGHAGQPDDDGPADLQNAYSRQASVEVEQQLGERRRSASAISTCAARTC